MSTDFNDQIEIHMKFYNIWDKVYGDPLIELVRKWYQTALDVPTEENPLMGDDLDGVLNQRFITSLPSDKSHSLLICGGSWEQPSLRKGNENRVFIRKAILDTNTIVLVSVINVVLPAGGHLAKEHNDTPSNRRKGIDEMREAMAIEKVCAKFKITGPHHNESSKPVGLYLDKKDLLFLSNEESPFMDVEGNERLETDPPEWKTLRMKKGFPSFTTGYYACFELKTPGTYIIDIDGSAPLAGHQDPHLELEGDADSEFDPNEKFFHNSAKYILEVRP